MHSPKSDYVKRIQPSARLDSNAELQRNLKHRWNQFEKLSTGNSKIVACRKDPETEAAAVDPCWILPTDTPQALQSCEALGAVHLAQAANAECHIWVPKPPGMHGHRGCCLGSMHRRKEVH